MAINSPYLEEETREAPGVVETLLLGNCDPDEFGRPEISPLTSALRIMDTEALCLICRQCDPGEEWPRWGRYTTEIASNNVAEQGSC